MKVSHIIEFNIQSSNFIYFFVILTGEFNNSFSLAATSCPLFGRINKYIFFISGHDLKSFSAKTYKITKTKKKIILYRFSVVRNCNNI